MWQGEQAVSRCHSADTLKVAHASCKCHSERVVCTLWLRAFKQACHILTAAGAVYVSIESL